MKTLQDLDLYQKKVFLRVDFNVPIVNGIISDDTRIKAALPTIEYLIKARAKIILLSHLGRVTVKADLETKTLAPVVGIIRSLLPKVNIQFIDDIEGAPLEDAILCVNPGDILLIENTRFADITDSNGDLNLKANRESGNNEELGRYWASLCDIYVNDAFGTAHRSHASNVGIAHYAKEAGVGLLIERELKMLSRIIHNPDRPFIAIIGGAKISGKIEIINKLVKIADYLIIGGAMAFVFTAAKGLNYGNSKIEVDKINLAKSYLSKYGDKILLPVDYAESKDFTNSSPRITTDDNIDNGYMGLDIGPKSIQKFSELLSTSKTVFWNGPFGVFEFSNYATGTLEICKTLANLKSAFRIIGGGDSAAAAVQLGYGCAFNHISTGGGAALDFIAGKPLPGIDCLTNK